jgi:sensor histidine kinase YesM
MTATLTSLPQRTGNWFTRYKLYHIPFWLLYHYLWWTVTVGDPLVVLTTMMSSIYVVKYLFYVVFQALGVYFNLYFLMPRYLEKGQYVKYIMLLTITVFMVAVLIVPGYYFSAWLSDRTFQDLYGRSPSEYMHFFQINTFPSSVASMTLGMSIKLAKNWIQSKSRQQQLEKEKLDTELKFLKSQMNPHFLFNTINSIFVLIHKNPMMASESLAKFSDLLRYQLYECNEHQIPLDQELGYLENFIELQKLRHDHDLVDLALHVSPYGAGNLAIAPFVLIPFIENAFKHVSRSTHHPNWIRMNLLLQQRELAFSITNSTSPVYTSSTEAVKHSGIGLKNVQRRLDLIYPGTHTLSIEHKDHCFAVTLQLTLHETMIPEMMTMSSR